MDSDALSMGFQIDSSYDGPQLQLFPAALTIQVLGAPV
jgi:hypothetical protein